MATTSQGKKLERMEQRVPAHVKRTIEHAAALEGRSASDFVTQAALSAAQDAIDRGHVVATRAIAESFWKDWRSSSDLQDSDEKKQRLEVRVPWYVKALVDQASQIEGRTMSDFVNECILAAAKRTVIQQNRITLRGTNAIAFVDAILESEESQSLVPETERRYAVAER